MLVTNVCHVPLSEAVAQTFDGAHPCDLCHTVAAGKNSEKKSQVRVTVAKVDLLCTTRSVSHLPPFVRYDYGAMGGTIPERFPAPPVPPPRLLPG